MERRTSFPRLTYETLPELEAKLARRARASTKRNKRRDRKIGLPAIVVFWLVAPLGVAGAALPLVLNYGWVYMTFSAILVQIGILMLNDRRGFIRSREMRRAYEARRHFSILETIILFLLIMGDMLVAAYAILMHNAP